MFSELILLHSMFERNFVKVFGLQIHKTQNSHLILMFICVRNVIFISFFYTSGGIFL